MKPGIGCVGHLVVLAAIVVAVDRLTSGHVPGGLRYVVSGAAGLFITTGLSNLWSVLTGHGRGDRSRSSVLERARTGQPPPQDGPFAVTGIVRAENGTLRAPISGVECVAYQYRLYTSQWLRGSKSDHREVPFYWGYASRGFRIDTPSRAFRILAVPRLADEATQHESEESLERAKAYVAATHFEGKKAITGIASSAATMFAELLREPAGDVRRDWKAEDVDWDFSKLRREETVVPVGATVSVAGRWSSDRGAIVPGDLGDGELGVTLVAGAATELELPSSELAVVFLGVVLIVAGAGLVWLAVNGRVAAWWGWV